MFLTTTCRVIKNNITRNDVATNKIIGRVDKALNDKLLW